MTDIQNLVEIVTQDYRWVLTFALPGYRVLRTIWTQLRRLVFDNLRRAHSSDHEEGLKATSLIRPVRRHTILNPREIRSLRRVPVEHNLGVSRILNFCVWVRLARLRPSSPKPAFTIADWELNRASEAHVDTSEFTPGGFELSVSLHAGESPRHLALIVHEGVGVRGCASAEKPLWCGTMCVDRHISVPPKGASPRCRLAVRAM